MKNRGQRAGILSSLGKYSLKGGKCGCPSLQALPTDLSAEAASAKAEASRVGGESEGARGARNILNSNSAYSITNNELRSKKSPDHSVVHRLNIELAVRMSGKLEVANWVLQFRNGYPYKITDPWLRVLAYRMT